MRAMLSSPLRLAPLLLAAVFLLAAGPLLAAQLSPPPQPAEQPQARQDDPRRTPVVRVVQQAGPAVVSIVSARQAAQSPFASAPQAQPPGPEAAGQAQKAQAMTRSLGSGVIIDGRKGYVLTNAHVITGSTKITARLMDGRELQASLVGADQDMDLAVLRLAAPESGPALPQARMGDSSDLLIGEPVIAIGNPFGLSHTVTTGVISALDRAVRTPDRAIVGLIQTDAAINPGNSGGPLLNILGQVVGINVAVVSKGEGLGFAIPINKARAVLDELIATGRVAHVWLGLVGENMSQEQAALYGLDRPRGVVVTEVFPRTTAEAVGIRAGDALLALGGKPVQDKAQLLGLLLNHARGETLELRLSRGREPFLVRLATQVLDRGGGLSALQSRWGFTPGPDAGPAATGIAVAAVRAEGPAARLGLRPGDVVVQVGSLRTQREADLLQAFFRYQMHDMLLLSVQRGGQIYAVRMKL